MIFLAGQVKNNAFLAGGLVGADIHLAMRSTGATENAILCATLAKGVTRIWNPHIRPEILDLIALLRKIAERNGLEGLSMGMSADFETAIAQGATCIRVGSAIFGERPAP